MRSVVIAVAVSSVAFGASAQTEPKPVDQMSCDELWAEVMTTGLQMKGQMDPRLTEGAKQAHADATDPARRAKATADTASMTAACSIPGAGAACAAMQQRYIAQMQAQAKVAEAQRAELFAGFQATTAGIDMQRMQAIEARTRSQKCPQPTGPGG